MVTTKITIKPHLAEYCIGLFNNHEEAPVRFPDTTDLYHLIFDLLERRPVNVSFEDQGNLEIILPERSVGKRTSSFNYLGQRSAKMIGKKLEHIFWMDVHDTITEEKHIEGNTNIKAVVIFIRKYGISSITEDALLKNYYRWKEQIRKKAVKRKYTTKNS